MNRARLEDRLTPALQLSYGGASTALSLTETSAGSDGVTVSEAVAGTLRIDLNGDTFAAGSSLTGVTYQNAGSPTTSTFATIDISAKNNVTTFTVDTGANGDTIDFSIATNASGGVADVAIDGGAGADSLTLNGVRLGNSSTSGSITTSAETIAVSGTLDTTGATNGAVALSADDMAINAAIKAGSAIVTLQQATATSRPIDLGLGTTLGSLGLTPAELNQVTAGTLRIGRTDNAGDIGLTGQIALTGTNTLSLRTGGQIIDATATEIADITVTNLALQTGTGIGNGNPIDIDAMNLSFVNSSSGLTQLFDRSGGVTIASVDGITTSSAVGSGFVKTSSPLTISMNTTVGGDFTFTAGGNAAVAGDDLTIDNCTVKLNSASNATVTFNAGDDIVFKGTGNVVTTGGKIGLVLLNADQEGDVVTDGDGGTVTQDTAATVSVFATSLRTNASQGIGTAATRFRFNAIVLVSISSGTDQFLREEDDIVIQALTAGAGNIDLLAGGSILSGSSTVSANALTLSAARAIGEPGTEILSAVNSLTLSTTGAGPFSGFPAPGIWVNIVNVPAVTVTSATTVDGAIKIFAAGGSMSVTTASAGGSGRDLELSAGGDLTVGSVSAAGDLVSLNPALGKLIDGNGAANNIDAVGLLINTDGDVGSAADPLETTVTNVAWNTGIGSIDLVNTGLLNVTSVAVFGNTITGGQGTGHATVTAKSPLTIAANVVMGGDVLLTAGETNDGPTFADKLTVNAGIKVESTGGDVVLQAGDNIVLDNASLVKATTAGKLVTLQAGAGDLDGGGAITIIGANSIVATNLAMIALTGIGTLANPVTTTVSNLEAQTNTGGIFVDNTGDLSIGNVLASLNGVRTTISGGVQVTTTGNLDLAKATVVYIVSAATGDVLLKAGAGKDLTVSVNNDAVQALKGSVTLEAGQDIKLGTTAANFDNDVDADRDINFIAGRDIVVDTNADVRADSFGNATGGQIAFSAGRHITLGPTPASSDLISTQLGAIRFTTGAAGAFTLTNGAQVLTTGGDVTITADNVVIDPTSTINAGTGCVIVQQETLANKIDVGGADGAGTLGLTNAELGQITAADIRIGQAGGGALTVTQKITLAQPLELIAGAGGISETGVGALEVDDLILVSTGPVTMNGDNKVKNLAGSAGGDFAFRDLLALNVTTVTVCDDTVSGITVPAGFDISLTADTITISQPISGDCVKLLRATAGVFDLGTTITDASIDNITANVLQIGDAAADSITISGTITVASVKIPVVDLRTAQTIANTGGTLAGSSLVFAAGKAVTLTGANTFGTVAGTSGGKLEITSSGKLTVGAVTNCDGITIKGVNSAGNDIVLIADDLELVEAVTATGACVTLTPPAAGKINLGSEVVGSFSLKDSELAKITAAKLQLGSATAGPITVAAAINPTSLTHLYSSGSVTGTGVITVGNLAITSGDSVSLTSANDVDVLAGTANGSFRFTDSDDLKIDSVAACVLTETGITSQTGDVALSTGKLLTLNANVKAANTITLNAITGGISQTAGTVVGTELDLTGSGTFHMPKAGNDVNFFTANTTLGNLFFSDTDDLTIGAAGIKTGSQPMTIQTGSSFNLPTGVTIDLGTASGLTQSGFNDVSKADTSTTIKVNGVIIADPVNGFRIDGGIGSNSIDVTPSKTAPLFIFGNPPVPAEVSTAIVGDSLAVQTAALGAAVGLFNVDKTNGNGVFTFTDPNNAAIEKARPVIYNSIENIAGFSIQAAAVQTSATTYNLVVAGKFNGGPFRGGFTGTLPPVAPFLVSPNLTNPLGPFTAPQVAIGDVDGDGLPDLVIGFGLNSGSPLVTVVDGIRIFNSSKAGQPLVLADIMTQFFAYHPAFQGGVFVAAGDTDGDGRSNIITGAGAGGGPHVKVFSVDPTRDPDGTFKTKSNSNAKVDSEFFAYAASFTGGVRVAAGDVTNDGLVDIVTAAGAGGGPHVRVFKPNGALEREFFAYSANFLGGVFVDVGDYNGDGFGDILTGAGFGGGPHVRVFDGQTLTNTGAQLILNEFFDDPPSTINPTPFQDDASALSAGVTGVGFGNFEDTTSILDIFVGSGLGRRTKVRIYQNGSHSPVSIAGKPFDFLSNGTNYLYDNRRDGAHVAVGGAFLT